MYVYSEAPCVWKQPVKTKVKVTGKIPFLTWKMFVSWKFKKKGDIPNALHYRSPTRLKTQSLVLYHLLSTMREPGQHSEGPFLCQDPGYEPI
jgi:hypothetical protein